MKTDAQPLHVPDVHIRHLGLTLGRIPDDLAHGEHTQHLRHRTDAGGQVHITGGNRNRIRLATAPNRGATIYSKLYNPFSRRYPDIALSLTELYATEQPGAIARGTIDLALGAGGFTDDTTDIPIAYEELLISLPAAHPLAGQERIRLEELRETPFVLQGPRHSIRILAEQLFRQAGFHPVVAFESDDVLLVDSMMHQAVGVGFVSKAHVFPCEELVYRPLDPPVRQTLHLRYPLGHTLTEPEYYLAGLLAEERLADPRYQPADDPFVTRLLETVRTPIAAAKSKSTLHGAVGTALQTVQEVNWDTTVMEYLIAIVDEQSLSKAAQRYFLAQPAVACEADLNLLPQLANLGIADCIMPLNTLERSQHLRCAAFEPPKPLYLLLASHVGRTLPTVTKELVLLIQNALADVLELPKSKEQCK